MMGTTIGFDEESNNAFIRIVDRQLENNDQFYIAGEKQYMTKIDKPSWLLDATSEPPRTNDDFLGWYQPVWFPYVMEIQKDGPKYLVTYQLPDKSGVWKPEGKPRELTPIPGRLGFTGFDRKNRHNLTYNEILERFELTKQRDKRQPAIIRMPLARVSPHPKGAAVLPPMRIGIPSWH